MPLKVFVDSDVIISSLISSTGAACILLNQKDLDLFISNVSLKELENYPMGKIDRQLAQRIGQQDRT